MSKKIRSLFGLIILFLFLPVSLLAQYDADNEVRLFQSFFRDVQSTSNSYGEASYNYDNFDFIDITTAGAQVVLGIDQNIELGSAFYYITRIPDEFDGEKGIADVPVYAKYNFLNGPTQISAGFFATIPVGDEDIGEGNLDFGPFVAFRRPASETVTLTGTFGIDFRDTAIEDYEASMNFGGGVIYEASRDFHVVGELKVMSDLDYSAITGGFNYQLVDKVHLRGNMLLGLDQNAPDFGFRGGILISP